MYPKHLLLLILIGTLTLIVSVKTATAAEPAAVVMEETTPLPVVEISAQPELPQPVALSYTANPTEPEKAYRFGNPAGCFEAAPTLQPQQMLSNVQSELGAAYNLSERRQYYVWNALLGTYVDATEDPFVYEFIFNEFQHPLTYRADEVVTIFINNGFVVWLRAYGNAFRLTAFPLVDGILDSSWAEYVHTYWKPGGQPADDTIYPVIKKLPCHWAIDASYASQDVLDAMFSFDWRIPDYMQAGQQYLAGTCQDAYRVSQEKVGYWDATSMCGPLAWTLVRDVNGFPYRIGSWNANADTFTNANPKWNGQPWGSFDPDTYDLYHIETPMPGYDFENRGNLYPGDLIYAYSTLYDIPGDQRFDHIFLVAAVDENGARWGISNIVQNYPYEDCSIEEVLLYTPGDRESGVINHEWNGMGYGITGSSGFDVFRWKWITYHNNNTASTYTVRWGDTLETIAFDWKVAPEAVAVANQLSLSSQLFPGQTLMLPAPSASPLTVQ